MVGAVGYVVGVVLSDPDSEALISADETVFALVPVEERPIVEGVALAGEASAGDLVTLPYYLPDGTQRAVVTEVAVNTGQVVKSGEHLLSVSGRPVFALQMDMLPYRDLMRDSRGADVLALKSSIAKLGYTLTEGDRFDWSTEVALQSFYEDRGYSAPGGAMPLFDMREFLIFHDSSPLVHFAPSPGVVLTPDSATISLQVTAATLVLRANLLEAEYFPLGAIVSVRGASPPDQEGEVVAIGDFQPAGEGKPPGVDVRIELLGNSPSLVVGQSYTVSVQATQEVGPAVPLAAVRQSSGETYILVDRPDGALRIDVRVLAEGSGWVSIEPMDELPPDSLVIIE